MFKCYVGNIAVIPLVSLQ